MSRKKTFIHLIQISFFFLITLSCYKEELVYDELEKLNNSNLYLSINNKEVAFDFERGIALFPINDYAPKLNALFTFQNISEFKINGLEIKNGENIVLENLNKDQELNISFNIGNNEKFNGLLIFTLLPIVQVNTSIEIIDEPKVSATFKITDTTISKTLHSYCGIEIRGGISSGWDKKSYGIELWEDKEGAKIRDEKILGLRNDDDWILDAMHIDKAKMRNRVSFDLWKEIVKNQSSQNDYTKGYINGAFVELFVNNKYQGLYCLNERLDAKQLDIVRSEDEINGLLYKSEDWSIATVFKDTPDTTDCFIVWAGWEQKHPKPELFSTWLALNKLIDFVAFSSDEEFSTNVYNQLNKENLIDYFILLNLTNARDNVGKNLILAKNESNSSFYICPWDLDASWGRTWDAKLDTINDILSIKMYDRLMELNPRNFKSDLQQRWFDLREQIVTREHIKNTFAAYKELFTQSGAYERETKLWPQNIEPMDQEIEHINQWSSGRIQFLDDFFTSL